MFKPEHLNEFDKHPPHFMWHTPPPEGTYYVAPCTVNRDSGCLERSNWRRQVAILDEYIEDEWEGVVGFNHFLVGWAEVYLISADNEEALMHAESLAISLEDYPVLDEMDYSELELNEANEFWATLSIRERADYAEIAGATFKPMQLRHDYIGALDDIGELTYYLTDRN